MKFHRIKQTLLRKEEQNLLQKTRLIFKERSDKENLHSSSSSHSPDVRPRGGDRAALGTQQRKLHESFPSICEAGTPHPTPRLLATAQRSLLMRKQPKQPAAWFSPVSRYFANACIYFPTSRGRGGGVG